MNWRMPYGQSPSILLKCYSIRISNETYNFDNRYGYECMMLQCADALLLPLLLLVTHFWPLIKCRFACCCVKPIDLLLSLIFTQSCGNGFNRFAVKLASVKFSMQLMDLLCGVQPKYYIINSI